MKIEHQGDYRVARRLRYPALEELADALVHQASGNDEPLQAYITRCQAVKAACPKPEIKADQQ